MSDQIKSMLQAMANNHDLIGRLYETPQGIYADDQNENQVTKLLRLNVIRRAHDDSYRLESNLRRLIDKALNRSRQFGISTHYQDILANLHTAVEGYTESLIVADPVVLSTRLNTIFELCDDFASGMTEDLEQFRSIVQTNAGFSGSTLDERIRYNENRLKRAKELIDNLASARDPDLVEKSKSSNDLARVLQKEFFDRHGGLQLRLREVAGNLSQNLFTLRRLDEAALELIRLDNHLTKYPDFETPAWEIMDAPPECFTRFDGFDIDVYPEPDSASYGEELGAFITKIRDELPAPTTPRRGNQVEDDGAPPEKTILPSQFQNAFYDFIETVLEQGAGSAVDWLDGNRDRFNYDPVVWLQMISIDYSNEVLDIPREVVAEPVRHDTGEELLLTDFVFSRKGQVANV